MALTTTYIVVPFIASPCVPSSRGTAHGLHPGTPRRSPTREAAIAIAEQLALFHAGVIVLRDRNDPAAGVFLEPLLICAIGDVPGDLLQQLAA